MATWMVHFRIAENLLNLGLAAAEKEFVVGNIGPDCGLPDKDNKMFIPPKEVTHFRVDNKVNPGSFSEQYLPKGELNISNPRDAFYLGYYVHLLTDVEWSKLHQIKKREPAYIKIIGTPQYAATIKQDWYGVDFIYLQEHQDNIFNKVFRSIQEFPDYLDFFPEHQIAVQIKRITEFYLGTSFDFVKDPAYRFQYLTPEEADQFVEDATRTIIEDLNTNFDVMDEKTAEAETGRGPAERRG